MSTELNQSFSDHSLVTVNMAIEIGSEEKTVENLEYVTKIPYYNWRQGTVEDWEK